MLGTSLPETAHAILHLTQVWWQAEKHLVPRGRKSQYSCTQVLVGQQPVDEWVTTEHLLGAKPCLCRSLAREGALPSGALRCDGRAGMCFRRPTKCK